MATSASRNLRGRCNCGRNTYVIEVPQDTDARAVREAATVVWDGNGAPTLRVPLIWYHSTTYALFPDETHSAIRRIYHKPSPSLSSHSQRHFCGYCGVRVSEWQDRDDLKEWLFVDLGSLEGESLVALEEWGVGAVEDGAPAQEDDDEDTQITIQEQTEGADWFEKIVTSSRGGKVKFSRGVKQERGRRLEWEVVEWTEGDEEAQAQGESGTTGKRKLRDVEGEGAMQE